MHFCLCCRPYEGHGRKRVFFKHVDYHVRWWVGVGGMITFLALAHMVDATQDAGLGGMLTFLALAHMLDATQDAGLGWGR